MERFEGNGAECMVRFIADGCNGTIVENMNIVAVVSGRNGIPTYSNRHNWLVRTCTYHPPEPEWKNASPGEALDAWLAGKTVQVRAATLDEAYGGEWASIGRFDGKHASFWQGDRKYRVQEE